MTDATVPASTPDGSHRTVGRLAALRSVTPSSSLGVGFEASGGAPRIVRRASSRVAWVSRDATRRGSSTPPVGPPEEFGSVPASVGRGRSHGFAMSSSTERPGPPGVWSCRFGDRPTAVGLLHGGRRAGRPRCYPRNVGAPTNRVLSELHRQGARGRMSLASASMTTGRSPRDRPAGPADSRLSRRGRTDPDPDNRRPGEPRVVAQGPSAP